MSTISGDMPGTGQSIGLVAGLALPLILTGSIAASASATATGYGTVRTLASGSATALVSGVARVVGACSGQGQASVSVSGGVRLVGSITGQGSTSASVSGGVYVVRQMAAASSAAGTVSGALRLLGTVQAAGSATASTRGVYSIVGSCPSSASAIATTRGTRILIGSCTSSGTSTATHSGQLLVIGSIVGSGQAQASLPGVCAIYGTVKGSGAVSSAVSGSFISRSFSQGSVSASVDGVLRIVGSISATTTATTNANGSTGATWYDRYWLALEGLISSTWSDVNGKIRQDNAMERFDWVNLINEGQLVAPWCVVELNITPTDEWGPGPHYSIEATIYYITSLAAARTTNMTAATFITKKLVALQAALYGSALPVSLGTVLDDIPFDTSAENAINQSMLSAKLDYQAGSLTVTSVVMGLG